MSPIANTLIIGKVLYHLDDCESTNLYAKQLIAKNKPPEGTVVLTDNQTAGRGQFGNSWQSAPHQNIALSVILYPNLNVNHQFYISKVVSIACAKALKSITNLDFDIKWPNDIYYKNQKVGGILIENQLTGSIVSSSVIGVGINVNQEVFEGLPNATSLYNLVRYYLNCKKISEVLLQHLDVEYIKLRQFNYDSIDFDYHQFLKSFKKEFAFKENDVRRIGILELVDIEGRLHVLVEGALKKYYFKEIVWEL